MIRFEVKSVFLDSKKVVSAVDKTTRRVFGKFGAFVRRSAKQSIRKRKKPAPPGKPPSSHTGLLKKFIFFGYDFSKRSVVIGPARFSSQSDGKAPSILEYGGVMKIKKKNATIKERPYMGPAMEKETPKIPEMWKNSVQ